MWKIFWLSFYTSPAGYCYGMVEGIREKRYPTGEGAEAAISYEQVLLSQISYCAKLINLIRVAHDYG